MLLKMRKDVKVRAFPPLRPNARRKDGAPGFSLREKDRLRLFHLPWVSFAGGGLKQNPGSISVERVFPQFVQSRSSINSGRKTCIQTHWRAKA